MRCIVLPLNCDMIWSTFHSMTSEWDPPPPGANELTWNDVLIPYNSHAGKAGEKQVVAMQHNNKLVSIIGSTLYKVN